VLYDAEPGAEVIVFQWPAGNRHEIMPRQAWLRSSGVPTHCPTRRWCAASTVSLARMVRTAMAADCGGYLKNMFYAGSALCSFTMYVGNPDRMLAI